MSDEKHKKLKDIICISADDLKNAEAEVANAETSSELVIAKGKLALLRGEYEEACEFFRQANDRHDVRSGIEYCFEFMKTLDKETRERVCFPYSVDFYFIPGKMHPTYVSCNNIGLQG